MTTFEMQGLAVGDRVKIHPATDLFMRGERYATIEKVGRKWVHVRGHWSNRVFKLAPQYVDLA